MRLIRAEINGVGAFIATYGIDRCKQVNPGNFPETARFGFVNDDDSCTQEIVLILAEKFPDALIYHIVPTHAHETPMGHWFDSSQPFTKTLIYGGL
jgi:hypothetical protein